MSTGMQGASYSPTLQVSDLSDTGLAMGNSHFVALVHSRSLPEFVPLGW